MKNEMINMKSPPTDGDEVEKWPTLLDSSLNVGCPEYVHMNAYVASAPLISAKLSQCPQ